MSDLRTADTSSEEFLAGRALAMRGDPWAELNQRYPAPPPTGAAKTEAPPPPPNLPTPPDAPIGQRILSRLSGIASVVGGVTRGAGEAIGAEAAASTAMEPVVGSYLKDVVTGKVAARGLTETFGDLPGQDFGDLSRTNLARLAQDPQRLEQATNIALSLGGAGTTERAPPVEPGAVRAPGEPAPAEVSGFTTAKGSTYELHDDGTTTRDKSFHPEHGEADQGPQPRSEATIFVTPKEADRIGGRFQAQGGGTREIVPLGDGRWGMRYVDGSDAGKFERDTVVTPQSGPAPGLIPVEMFQGGRRVHFGNEITEVRPGEAPPVTAPPVEPGAVRAPVALQLPAYAREAFERTWATANRLGVVDDVERLAAEGKTAAQAADDLGSKLDPVRALARANNESERMAVTQFVRDVRSGLGIPSMDQASEYAAWLDAYRARVQAAPATAPVEPGAVRAPAVQPPPEALPPLYHFTQTGEVHAAERTPGGPGAYLTSDENAPYRGQRLNVEVPGATTQNFLDWAGPLSEREQKITKDYLGDQEEPPRSGQDLFHTLRNVYGEPEAVKILRDNGILGSKAGNEYTLFNSADVRPVKNPLALGDPLAPAVSIKPATQAEQAMAEVTLGRMPGEGEPPSIMSEEDIHNYLAGARVDNPVKVNLARIGSGDDIADTLAQVSKTIPPQAVQTNEATRFLSDALGLTPEQLLQGYRGQQLNAAETTAMRFMLDSSAQQLVELAQKARDPLATAEDIAAFTKGFTVHRALQQYMENARAEAGRTLQSWKIMSEQRDVYGRAISKLVADSSDDITELAGKIADLSPLQAGRLVASSTQGTARDFMLAVAYNAWLSSPTTLVKKIASDIGMATWNLATRGLAETAGRVGLGSGAIVPGETTALAFGYMNSLTDALRAGGKGLLAGRSQFLSEFATREQPFRLSQLANGYPAPIEAAMPTKAMIDYIRPFFPTSWIAGADDFAKVWQYRAQLRALAWRSAEGDPERFAQLLEAPPQSLHQQALQGALQSTFQEPLTGAAEALRNVVDAVNIPVPGTSWQIPVGRVIMPFLKVPVNIARMAYRSSPLAVVFPSPAVRAIMATPGASRDLLMAQIGLGTAVDTALVSLALNGNITGRGPTDPGLNHEWQAAGNQPYSLQLPGARPIQLNQIEPFGQHFATIADTINLMKFAKEEDAGDMALSLGFGIGNAMLSKTYFEGIANFLDAMTHPDQNAARYTSNLVAGFVPTGLQHLAKAGDDWMRAHYGMLDAIENNLPWLREGLPPARSLWGDPIPVKDTYLPFLSGTAAAQMVSPVNMGPRPEDVEPIDRWIWDHHLDFDNPEHGIEKPPRHLAFSVGPGLSIPAELNAKQYDRFVEQAGNGLKNPNTGLGAKDLLNALVEGRGPMGEQRAWNEASPAEQTKMVQTIVSRYREAAKAQLWQPHEGVAPDFPELTQAIMGAAGLRAGALMGQPR